MSFVKVLFGNIVGELSLSEGQIGETDRDWAFKDLEKKGIVKIFNTYEEAEAFKYVSSRDLFNQSYKALNPAEGEVVPESLIDWGTGPKIVDGVPANYVKEEEVKTEVKAPASSETKAPKSETPKAPASDPLTPAADADKK